MFWSCLNTSTINVTRLGAFELMSVGPILTGGEDRRPRFLAIHPPDQKLFVSVAGEYLVPGEEGGSRIDVIDLTTGKDKTLLDSNAQCRG